MSEEKKEKSEIRHDSKEKRSGTETASLVGPMWYIGWLFTVAFAKLSVLKAVLGLVIWPYYLGLVLAG